VTLVRLVADDLTGALDAAAQFSGSAAVQVRLRPTPPYPACSFVLDLSCRDGTRHDAIKATLATLDCLKGAGVAFKKIDSLLRGHWAAELAAIASTRFFQRIVLAPAFPAQGRITRGGRQIVVSSDGAAAPVRIDPVAALAICGAPVSLGWDSPGNPRRTTPIHLCDAETEADLLEIVARGEDLPGPTLWCGSAGLARALAEAPPPKASPPRQPHLVIVGTHHAVTRAQVERVACEKPEWIVHFDSDGPASAARIATTLGEHGRCVALAELRSQVSAPEAARLISDYLGSFARFMEPPATATVVGGETFAALCRALGAEDLSVVGEASPGVPASQLTSGRWTDVNSFSKSGAFGDAAWLLRHLV